MTLEDHAGDIVQKARLGLGIAAETAAQAAGLNLAEWAALEATGRAPKPPRWAALAELLGLHAQKLEFVARGWAPPAPDLGAWRELRVIATTSGGMGVNAFLAWDEVTRDAALFDTGWEAAPILAAIAENALQLRHLFITHHHADHVAAVEEIRSAVPRIRLHSGSRQAPVDQRNRPQECVALGSLRISHRETPGHSEDGTTYLVGNWPEDAPHVAFVGDALFAGSLGRATGPAYELARQKAREQILSLPPDALLCPGHGPLTTVALEKAHNPFFP